MLQSPSGCVEDEQALASGSPPPWSKRLAAPAALLVAVFCWGLAPVATRYLVTRMNPLHLLILRSGVAALFFLPALLRARVGRWPAADLRRTVLCGLAGTMGYHVPVIYGTRWVPAGITGLLVATEPAWIALLSMLIVGERLAWRVWAGLVLAAVGVVAVVGWGDLDAARDPFLPAGAGLILLGALMWAAYSVAVRPLSRAHGALASTGATTLAGTVPVLLLSDRGLLTAGAGLGPAGWGALLLLAVGSSVVATVLWNYGLARVPAARGGLFLHLIPLVSVLGGRLFLNEPVGIGTVAGGAIIVVGVALAQTEPAHRRAGEAVA